MAGPFAVNTYSYIMSRTAEDCLRHLARQGYRRFELMLFPGHLWPSELGPETRHRLRRFIADAGFEITTLNMPNIDVNLAAATVEMREYSLQRLEEAVVLAGELGVPAVLIGPGKPNPLLPLPRQRMTDHLFTALDRLAPLALRSGTSIALENLPIAFLPDAEAMMATLAAYGDPAIGIVYDVANAVFHGEDPVAGLSRVSPRLRLIHLSDTTRERYRHAPVGEGIVPFAALPAALAEIGYAGPSILEIISDTPDRDIHASAERLKALGWPAH